LESEILFDLRRRWVLAESGRRALRRSRHNRVIAGVCGGLSEFFGISAFWFRLGFILAALPGGIPGIVPYLICWIIIPKEPR
jgi:phage shock protein C